MSLATPPAVLRVMRRAAGWLAVGLWLLLALPAQAQLFLNVNKSFSPINLNLGQTSIMTITFASTSPDATVTNVSGTDTLPAGLSYLNAGAGTCGFTTTVSALETGGATLRFGNGALPPAGQCAIGITVVALSPGTWVNTIPPQNVTGQRGTLTVPGFATASATITAGGTLAPLTGSKSASGTLHGGGTASFTITYQNNVALSLSGLGYTDTLPAQLVMQVPPGVSSNTCGGTVAGLGGGAVADGSGGFTLSNGTLAGSAACSLSFVVRPVNTTTSQQGTVTNAVPQGATTSLGLLSPAVSTTLRVERGVTIGKAFAPASIQTGQTSLLTISLNNFNLTPISGASVTDTFPLGVSGVSLAGVGAACGAPTVNVSATQLTASGLTLPAAPSATANGAGVCTLTAVVTSGTAGTYPNTIPAGTFTGGFPYAAASANLTVTNPPSALRGTKTFAPTTVPQGGVSVLTVTLSNTSTSTATSVAFTDLLVGTMGTTFTVALSPVPVNNCGGTLTANAGSTSFSLSGGVLAPQSTCTIVLGVAVDDAAVTGNRTNSIPIGSLTSSIGSNSVAINGVLVVTQVVRLTKAFSPTSVPQTGTSLLTITLINDASNPNAGILSFTETLATMGAGITVADSPAATNTCGGTLTAAPGSVLISLSGGTIVSGGSCQLRVPVTVTANVTAGNKVNTVPVGNLRTDQGNNTAAATATLGVVDALRVAKSFAPATVSPGGTTRLTLTLTHANLAVPFTGLAVTDALPGGVVVAATPNVANTCGGTVAAIAGASSVQLSGGALPSGTTTCSLSVDLTAPLSSLAVVNTITVGSVTTAQGAFNLAAATASLVVTTGTAATLNKSFSPVNISSGERSQLQVLIVNPNAYPLTNVTLTDPMPAGMVVDAFASPATSCAGGVVTATPGQSQFTLSGATVPASGQCTFTANVTSYVGGNSINTIPLATMTSAQGVSNANAPAATLQVLFNVNIGKRFSPAVVPAGLTSSLVVSLYNSNTVTAVGLTTGTFSDILPTSPGQMEIASSSALSTCGGTVRGPGGAALAPGQTSFRLDGGSLPAGSSCDVTVVVRTTSPTLTGTFVNTLAAGALVMDVGTNPTPAVATVTFVANPTLVKTFTPASMAIGDASTLTFTLGNANSAALFAGGLTGAGLTDTLPAGLSVRNPGPLGGTCAGASGNSVSAGDAVLSLSGLTIPPAGTCSVTVSVQSAGPGVYVNTVSGLVTAQTLVPTTLVSTATLTVLTPPSVSKSFSPTSIASGGTGTSVLTVRFDNPNATPLTLASPGFLDVFPTSPGAMVMASAGVVQSCGSTVNDSANGGLAANDVGVRINGGTIPANGSCTVAFTVTMPLPGTYLNSTGPVTTTNAGASLSGATASVTITPQALLSVTKSASLPVVTSGEVMSYTVTVDNQGPAAGNGTVVTDPPVDGLQCTALNCSASGGAVCPINNLSALQGAGLAIPTLPAGSQVVLVLTCTVTATGR